MSENNQCVIVGIAGASASGKSLIASTIYNELRAKVGDHQIGVITEDCYYKDQSHLSMEERVKTNYDHPSALDHDLLCQHLQMLARGEAVEVPEYSYTEHTRTEQTTTMTPKKVIILEGILLLTDPRLRDLMHATVFMDTPLDICLLRRVKRDVQERGRTMESVLKQYQETVRPMFMQFIEPSKQYADIIVPRGGKTVSRLMFSKRISQNCSNRNFDQSFASLSFIFQSRSGTLSATFFLVKQGKADEKLFISLLGLVVLIVGALLALVLLVNPNQFKPLIVEQAKNKLA